MNQINHAIHEIRSIDFVAGRNQWVNRIHPLVKLVLTIFYIASVTSFPRYDFMGLLGMGIYPLFLFQLGEVAFREALHRLRIVLPVVCLVGIWNPLLDTEILTAIGGVPVSAGMISMLTLMLKGIFTVFAAYLLIATTKIEDICYALRLLHVPKLFVTQILLSYRYISVLLAEANRMSQAYALRAPGQKGIHYKVWGTFIGQLLLKSMDRAEELYESMCLRGYQGEFYYGIRQKLRWKDFCYLFFWMVLILIFRLFPVFYLVGNLFL